MLYLNEDDSVCVIGVEPVLNVRLELCVQFGTFEMFEHQMDAHAEITLEINFG